MWIFFENGGSVRRLRREVNFYRKIKKLTSSEPLRMQDGNKGCTKLPARRLLRLS